MTDMTPERIAEIRERVAKSSKGIWKTHPIDDTTIISEDREIATTCDSSNTERDDAYNIEYEVMEADAQFIAHARQDIPDLLAALTAANERAERAEQALHGALRYADEAGRFAETIATLEAENARLRQAGNALIDYANKPETPSMPSAVYILLDHMLAAIEGGPARRKLEPKP